MNDVVMKAILWLCAVSPGQAQEYAKHVVVQSERREVDPLLVVAMMYSESRCKRRVRSRTNDYGLMQLHVAPDTHASYQGREHLLFDPRRNIRLGVKVLALWRNYHFTRCRNPEAHHWWSHYQWGGRVRNPRSGARVAEIYGTLRRRFSCRRSGEMLSVTGAFGDADTRTSKSSKATPLRKRSKSFSSTATIQKTGGTSGGTRFLAECTL